MTVRGQTYFRQFIQRATDERRAQHGDARNILQRIVEQLQQAQQIQNLAAVIKSAALDNERNSGAVKLLRKNLRLAGRRPQQNGHVAPFDGADDFSLVVPDFVAGIF